MTDRYDPLRAAIADRLSREPFVPARSADARASAAQGLEAYTNFFRSLPSASRASDHQELSRSEADELSGLIGQRGRKVVKPVHRPLQGFLRRIWGQLFNKHLHNQSQRRGDVSVPDRLSNRRER